MAPSTKLAVLTSLGFIVGICWVVSVITPPMRTMPSLAADTGLLTGVQRGMDFGTPDEPRIVERPRPEQVTPALRERLAASPERFADAGPLAAKPESGRELSAAREWVRGGADDGSAYRGADVELSMDVEEIGAPARGSRRNADDGLPPLAHAQSSARLDEPDGFVPEAVIGGLADARPLMLTAVAPVDRTQSGRDSTDADRSDSSTTQNLTAAQADASEARRTNEVQYREYRVKPGDSLVRIMRRVWDSDDDRLMKVLLKENPRVAKRPDKILVGEQLRIPDLESARRLAGLAASPADPVDDRSSSADKPLAAARANPLPAGGKSISDDFRWYRVRESDSLARIARAQLGSADRWREIVELNSLRNPNRIFPGMRIKLPVIDGLGA